MEPVGADQHNMFLVAVEKREHGSQGQLTKPMPDVPARSVPGPEHHAAEHAQPENPFDAIANATKQAVGKCLGDVTVWRLFSLVDRENTPVLTVLVGSTTSKLYASSRHPCLAWMYCCSMDRWPDTMECFYVCASDPTS